MKTAVEWLQSQFENTDGTELVSMNIEVWFEQAKEMERKQIIEARLDIYITGDLSAEEYYNEKFKSE